MRKVFAIAVFVASVLAAGVCAAGADSPSHAPGTPVWESLQPAGTEGLSSQGKGVAVDPEGNLLVTGFVQGDGGNFDLLVLKYSPQGGLVWSRRYDYSWYDVGTAVASDGAGNVIVAGASNDPDNPSDIYLRTYYTDYLLLKYSPDGGLVFEVTASGNDRSNVPAAVCAEHGGDVYVTGRARDAADTHNAYYTVKFSAAGEVLWERMEDWGTEALAAGMALLPDGVVVTGGVWDSQQENLDIKTVKYSRDAGGALAASTYRTRNEYYDETAYALSAGPGGALYVAGRTSESDGTALTLKLDAGLAPVWAEPLRTYDRQSEGRAAGVDEHGRVYVAARTGPTSDAGGLLLLVYGPDGMPLDAREVELGYEFAVEAMAVEPDGDLVLTGTAFAAGEPDRMATVRLAGYPAGGHSYFDLEGAFVRGEPLSLSRPPTPMLRKVLLDMKHATLYGCLPVTVFVAEPVAASGELEYSFLVTRGGGLEWERVREYSPIRFWVLPPRTGGDPVTGVMVQVREAGSGMAYQAKEWVYLDGP